MRRHLKRGGHQTQDFLYEQCLQPGRPMDFIRFNVLRLKAAANVQKKR